MPETMRAPFRHHGCRFFRLGLLTLIWVASMVPLHADEEKNKDYLYYREITIAPYQNMREFFDLPDRPGNYQVTMLSQAMTPLTFNLIRLRGEEEQSLQKTRSFSLGNHRFEYRMDNPDGDLDLAVEVANSNPTMKVTVTIVVVETVGS